MPARTDSEVGLSCRLKHRIRLGIVPGSPCYVVRRLLFLVSVDEKTIVLPHNSSSLYSLLLNLLSFLSFAVFALAKDNAFEVLEGDHNNGDIVQALPVEAVFED